MIKNAIRRVLEFILILAFLLLAGSIDSIADAMFTALGF